MNAFSLKIIAMIFMFLEHSTSFFSRLFSRNITVLFETTGRIVAPIFFFLAVESFFHTRNRLSYLQRLYLWAVIMAIGSFFIEIFARYYFHPERFFGIGDNIFLSIAFNITTLYWFEWIKTQRSRNKKALGIILVIIFTFFSLMAESSYIGIGMFYIFYFLRNRTKVKFIAYALFSLFFLLIALYQKVEHTYVFEYQWVMILAIPFFWLYNGEKGPRMKYLFYIFYPLHLWLLFLLAYFTGMR